MDIVCKNKYFCGDNKRFLIMTGNFSEELYEEMMGKLFVRFPSFQKVGAGAYKPGIANMQFADQLMGHPHRNYKIIHVAGTNGKGSTSNMLASALAAAGYKVGLYTSPHILDFRERMRVVTCCHPESMCHDDASCHPERSEGSVSMISKQEVWNFVQQWTDTFDHLDMSFFEITTMMALDWFARQEVDYVVLETGLGGRLDSTNIVTPVLSVITNIGLDHCDMLGETLPEIAFEKAGIIKPLVPVVVGESHPETDEVFERKVLYTNLPEAAFMGNRTAIMSLLTFADRTDPVLWGQHEEMLREMDLKGEYQQKNLRTALAALTVLAERGLLDDARPAVAASRLFGDDALPLLRDAIIHTAARTGFRGRWEKLSDNPYVICDIGHNEHGLKYNFAQLARMMASGEVSDLIMVYGSVADKDVDAVISLMPEGATYVFTQASGKRALPAAVICDKFKSFCGSAGRLYDKVYCCETVEAALAKAYELASAAARPLIYIGGSTYVVSEAVGLLEISF
jgi:dihydrofolate synthase/folylpolyglutamate synthase